LGGAFEPSFSSAYIAPKSLADQAAAKRSAASFWGEPGAPIAAPTTKATIATAARGRVRVMRRRRLSTSGDS
jgi:hypothetical protein